MSNCDACGKLDELYFQPTGEAICDDCYNVDEWFDPDPDYAGEILDGGPPFDAATATGMYD